MKKTAYNSNSNFESNLFLDTGRLVNLNGIETFVVESGQGECIIFIHGLAVTCYTWRNIITALKDRYHIFAFDLKGAGFSEKSEGEYSVEIYLCQIKSLIEHYSIRKATLVGNSLGGGIMLRYALKYPEDISRLILIDTVGYTKNKEVTKFLVKLCKYKAFRRLLKTFFSKRMVKIMLEWALENESVIDKEMIQAYYEPLKEEGGFEALTSLIKNLGYSDLNYEGIRNITIPTLIIWGDKDKWIPKSDAYKIHRAIKNSKLIILKDCGHGPQEEYPETISRLIENFMNL